MPEMSASAHQSIAVAVDADTDAATHQPTPAPAATTDIPAHHEVAPPAVRPCWRITTAGYLLLLLATAFAIFIPHLHLHTKIGEEALVLLDIGALVIATILIVVGYLRSLLRQI